MWLRVKVLQYDNIVTMVAESYTFFMICVCNMKCNRYCWFTVHEWIIKLVFLEAVEIIKY